MGTPSRSGNTSSGAQDRALRWRALASLYLAGAVIGTVSLVLPHSSHANSGALWANTALAYATAAVGLLLAGRLPLWANQVCLAAGTLVVTSAVYYSGEAESYYAIWYVWIALYAFSFYGRRAAIAHTSLVGVTYAGVLAAIANESEAARWLTTIATLLIAAVFVDKLVRALRRHAGAADASAARLAAVARAMQRVSRCGAPAEVVDALLDAVRGLSGVRSAEVGTGVPADAADAAEGRLAMPIASDRAAAGRAPCLVAELDGHVQTEVRRAIAMLVGEAANALTRIELVVQLEAAARTDDLTGLPNRRSWDAELERGVAQARRFGHPLCVAMLDLDGFKELNDSLGHQAGDEMLAAAARAWASEVRDVDTLARWGGDEFGLIVPACDLAAAAGVVERVRSRTPAGVTCSAGLVAWDGHGDPAQLTARVDAALYRAKRDGRDRLVVDSGSLAPSSG
jgi:diguanylate cyclase (GGDEF)-like protein